MLITRKFYIRFYLSEVEGQQVNHMIYRKNQLYNESLFIFEV